MQILPPIRLLFGCNLIELLLPCPASDWAAIVERLLDNSAESPSQALQSVGPAVDQVRLKQPTSANLPKFYPFILGNPALLLLASHVFRLHATRTNLEIENVDDWKSSFVTWIEGTASSTNALLAQSSPAELTFTDFLRAQTWQDDCRFVSEFQPPTENDAIPLHQVRLLYNGTQIERKLLKKFCNSRSSEKLLGSLVRFVRTCTFADKKIATKVVMEIMGTGFAKGQSLGKKWISHSADYKRIVAVWEEADLQLAANRSAEPTPRNAPTANVKQQTMVQADFSIRLNQQKMQAMQQLAYGASHEINNPLANISARAQSLLTAEQDTEKRLKLSIIYEQSLRAHEMISDLMLFANPPSIQRRLVNLRDWLPNLIDQVDELLKTPSEVLFGLGHSQNGAAKKALLESPRIEFRTLIASQTTTVDADVTQLSVALKCLIRNSIEAIRGTGKSGSIELRVSQEVDKSIKFTVTDDGPGIPESIADSIFDPFYSGREAGRGLGFGLSKAWRIAELHSGTLTVNRLCDSGVEFVMTIGPPSFLSPDR